jgi:hypothetical protein
MRAKTLLIISASIELATGIAMIASPRLVATLLFSAEPSPGGEALGRLGGCGLLCLAVACWPRGECLPGERELEQPVRALFLYNLLAACYFGYLELSGDFASPFLLPAAALHAILFLLFLRPLYETAAGRFPLSSKNP